MEQCFQSSNYRKLTYEERQLIDVMLSSCPARSNYLAQLESAEVRRAHGRKYVLQFRLPQYERLQGSNFNIVAEGVFENNLDQAEAFAILFSDDNDRIAELEIYRADGVALNQVPRLEKFRSL